MGKKRLLWVLLLCSLVEKLLDSEAAQYNSLHIVPTVCQCLACAVMARSLPPSALKSPWVWLMMECNSLSKTNDSIS